MKSNCKIPPLQQTPKSNLHPVNLRKATPPKCVNSKMESNDNQRHLWNPFPSIQRPFAQSILDYLALSNFKLNCLQKFAAFFCVNVLGDGKTSDMIKCTPGASIMVNERNFVSGDAIHFHIDQSSRVLPASSGDYSTYLTGCSIIRKVLNICHDSRVNKVSLCIILFWWYTWNMVARLKI